MNVGDCVFLKGFAKRMTIVAINGNIFHCCWYKEGGQEDAPLTDRSSSF